jgi:hypothetical protein
VFCNKCKSWYNEARGFEWWAVESQNSHTSYHVKGNGTVKFSEYLEHEGGLCESDLKILADKVEPQGNWS